MMRPGYVIDLLRHRAARRLRDAAGRPAVADLLYHLASHVEYGALRAGETLEVLAPKIRQHGSSAADKLWSLASRVDPPGGLTPEGWQDLGWIFEPFEKVDLEPYQAYQDAIIRAVSRLIEPAGPLAVDWRDPALRTNVNWPPEADSPTPEDQRRWGLK